MSILNVFVEKHQALIGADTAIVLPDTGKTGTCGNGSKILPLPHVNAVFGMRGHFSFFTIAFSICHASGGTFDELADLAPQILQQAFAQFVEIAPSLGLVDEPSQPWPLDRQEIVFVGWSNKLSRMIGNAFIQEDRSIGFVWRSIDYSFTSPGTEPGQPCYPDTIQNMVLLAQFQKRMLNDKAPGAAAGGRFIVALINRHGMTIAPACNLDRE